MREPADEQREVLVGLVLRDHGIGPFHAFD